MWPKSLFILFIVSILTSDFAFSQETPAKKDSAELYKNIESYSDRSGFTKFVYRLVFKPVAAPSSKKKVYKKLIKKPYSAFEGKTIRNINIVTLDPFGYSITDTAAAPHNFLIKAGNSIHVQSHKTTIRNLLLIRENQTFDSLLVKESERLVRSMGFIHEVAFSYVKTSANSDSVDVYIRELDNWSIIPKIGASTNRLSINLTDKNFLGMGHESQNIFTWYHPTGDYAYNINYYVPNIRNTFITTSLNYSADENRNYIRVFTVDRPFFSPFAKWAAGVKFSQQFRQEYLSASDSILVLQRFKFNAQDYWVGNAIRIFKGNTEYERSTNFISAVRFLRIRYLEKPIEIYDTSHQYYNQDFYLASIGISTRKYVQDKYIFKFGITEDLPVGKVYSLTGGYQRKNNTGRFYLGARFSIGNYYSWGYLSSNLEYGTFFDPSHIEQGVLTADVKYFTGLFEIGKWKFRQFIKPQAIFGLNRFAYDTLTLNDGYGLDGFNSSAFSGVSRLLLTLQTQSYAPWDLIGFHFGPFINCSFGMLADPSTGFKNSQIYSKLGIGVLIKNNYLVFNTFQISIAFYPNIPGIGRSVFKTNSFRTADFGFDDFEIGKPATVLYQ